MPKQEKKLPYWDDASSERYAQDFALTSESALTETLGLRELLPSQGATEFPASGEHVHPDSSQITPESPSVSDPIDKQEPLSRRRRKAGEKPKPPRGEVPAISPVVTVSSNIPPVKQSEQEGAPVKSAKGSLENVSPDSGIATDVSSQKIWTREELLENIDETGKFSLVSAGGAHAKYRWDGEDILNSHGEISTEIVLKRLNNGWTQEKPEKNPTPVVTPELVAEPVSVVPVPEIKAPELVPAEEASFPGEPSKPEEVEKRGGLEIGELRAEVDAMRLAFVTTDYNQNKAWNKITRVLGGLLGKERGDSETQTARENYERTLMKLQEAELTELKNSGLIGNALKERMGKMLQYYKYDERINLFKDRTEVAAEKKEWPQKVMSCFEFIGKNYNKLSPKQKMALAAGFFVSAGLLAFTGGAAGAAVGTGMVGIRRAIATLGAGVGMDILTDSGTEYLRKRSMTKEQEVELEELGKLTGSSSVVEKSEKNISDEAYKKLGEFTEKDIKSLDKKLQHQKWERLLRRSAVWGTAIIASSYFTYKAGMSFFGDHPKDTIATALRERMSEHSGQDIASGVVTEEHLAPPAPESPQSIGDGVSVDDDHTKTLLSGEGEATDISSDTEVADDHTKTIHSGEGEGLSAFDLKEANATRILEKHVVTAADGKKGLWGILEQRLPDDIRQLPKPEQNRIIASLENLMRQDLNHMSAAEKATAGFPKGDLDKIYAGKTIINFDQFHSLTADKIQAILEGESVTAPDVTTVVEGVGEQVNEGVSLSADVVDSSPPLEQVVPNNLVAQALADNPDTMETPPSALIEEYESPGDMREYLQVHPEKIGAFKDSLSHFRTEIFLTDHVQRIVELNPSQIGFTSPELGNVDVSRVIKDYHALSENRFTVYDRGQNPLHFSQMRQIDKLLVVAEKTFGPQLVQIPAGSNINDLTKYLTTLAFEKGKNIEGFVRIKP